MLHILSGALQNVRHALRISLTAVPSGSTSSNPHPQAAVKSFAGGTPRSDLPKGYPRLAERMGFVPEISIFRQFAFLNKLNTLYLQAELMHIEDQLKEAQREDDAKGGYEQNFARDWLYLRDGKSKQFELVLSAREKLEKYNTALIQQSHILQMKSPGESDMDYIRKYLASSDMGPWILDGIDSDVWGTTKEPELQASDLVALLPRKKEDMFSNIVMEKGMAKWFKYGLDRFRKPSPVHGLIVYEESTLLRLTYVVSTALASLLPVISIVILYFVHSMKARLGIIALFNILTSLCLAFFTTAKRTDIFAVAAAFSAVQVVFVQGDNVISRGDG